MLPFDGSARGGEPRRRALERINLRSPDAGGRPVVPALDARADASDGGGQLRHIAHWEDLARLPSYDQVRRAAHLVAHHARQSGRERLIDHEAPGLAPVAGQDEAIGGRIRPPQLGLVQKTRPSDFDAEALCLLPAPPVEPTRADHDEGGAGLLMGHRLDQVDGPLLRLELAHEEDDEVPNAKTPG